ncbi:MAG TPA: heme-binding protein [Gammaproteobacteria bacterium]
MSASRGTRRPDGMLRTTLISALATMALLAAIDSPAQGVVTQRILSFAAAKAIAEATLAECASKGFRTAAAVVDRAGNLLVLLRHEQASPATIEMARGKAYTALIFRTSTLEFQARTAADPALAPQRDVPGILALGGGVPIMSGDEIIGAVASSGSNQTTDDECAKAGVAKARELLE